jgi:hypothetical protein
MVMAIMWTLLVMNSKPDLKIVYPSEEGCKAAVEAIKKNFADQQHSPLVFCIPSEGHPWW